MWFAICFQPLSILMLGFTSSPAADAGLYEEYVINFVSGKAIS